MTSVSMPTSANRARQKSAILLAALVALIIVAFWAFEVRHTLKDFAEREEEILNAHQHKLLASKADEFRSMFRELYRSTGTVSLLHMVRSVSGGNRRNAGEDILGEGRWPIGAHQTMQQIYTDLQKNVRISEIYYVLDGFAPKRGEVPFFMYDDLIARGGSAGRAAYGGADEPPEVEEFEYEYMTSQLAWFRQNAGQYRHRNALSDLPVRLSPLLRTCDNTQFGSGGSVRDTHGFIYAMPVHDAARNHFKGMITVIVRANVLEAKLLGVPFVPVTQSDHDQMRREGWTLPPASPESGGFILSEANYGIEIHDRRNALFARTDAETRIELPGRWRRIDLDLGTDGPWQLAHYLAPAESEALVLELRAQRLQALGGRILLLAVLSALLACGAWLAWRSQRELLAMAHFDALTQLPNRRLFFHQLQAGIGRTQRNRQKLALFFVDIANFNAINDTHGHAGGDKVLIELGQRLRACLRSEDEIALVSGAASSDGAISSSVSRLGGDEFTIICEGVHGNGDLSLLAARLAALGQTPFRVGDADVEIMLDIGVAVCPDDATEADKLLLSADNAMQESRTQGGGYSFFNEAMRVRAKREHSLMLDLQQALELRQFELYFQPKAALSDGRIVSLEALLRWKHPEQGMISPVEFIPLLERSGRIIEVGAWVIEESCRALAVLAEAGRVEMKISANVSVRQLKRGDFHTIVDAILKKTGTPPERLVLEITESVAMDDLDAGRRSLDLLAGLGVRLAIDDFGTGYSSLTYLQHLPIHYLKLDKSFIDGMVNDRARHIVATVIRLAHGLSLQTIAEGIETPGQRDQVAALGCDMIQGYLLSKPVPLPEVMGWLAWREPVSGGLAVDTSPAV